MQWSVFESDYYMNCEISKDTGHKHLQMPIL